MPFYYQRYGEQNVKSWLGTDIVIMEISRLKSQQNEEQQVRSNAWYTISDAALDVIANAISGKYGDDHRVQTARWILAGERSYHESRGKVSGERSVDINKKAGTILELVMNNAKKTD